MLDIDIARYIKYNKYMNNSDYPRSVTCCFTGHRTDKLPWGLCESDDRCIALKKSLMGSISEKYDLGYRRFICGMAIGCDLYFAEAIIALRAERPDIFLEAAVPCPNQTELWPESQRLRYDELIDQCDAVTLVSKCYTPTCMLERNRYMADSSSAIIACYDGSPGGTMQTLLYARRIGLDATVIELKN